MMRALLVLGLSLLVPVLVAAQPLSPPPASCDEQVGSLYKQLVADKIIQEATTPAWQDQLQALVTQLRVVTTQYTIKKGQAEQAEGNMAQLLERLRQVQQQAPKAPAPPGEGPPKP